MPENIKKSTKVSFGCMSWPGTVLTIAIIAIRAFQPDATPIETWSASSWALMFLPMCLPIIIWPIILVSLLVWTFIISMFS